MAWGGGGGCIVRHTVIQHHINNISMVDIKHLFPCPILPPSPPARLIPATCPASWRRVPRQRTRNSAAGESRRVSGMLILIVGNDDVSMYCWGMHAWT